jgi:fructose-specific phosphotransferase system IIA component
MILTQRIQPDCVKVPVESNDKEAVIAELVDLLNEKGLLSDRDAALEAVLTRDRLQSTGIGDGIALPHGKCNAVRELVIAIGIAREPIDFNSIDSKPVKIIILLISPSDQTGPHIQALAKISRLMLNQEFRKQLENAASAVEVNELLSKE